MTGQRKRTPEQDAVLAQIAHAAAQERAVRASAEVEARALIAARMHEAATKTNALMYQAHYEFGITKTAITLQGLGTTNKQAADARLREYMQESGLVPADTIAARASLAPTPNKGLKVHKGEDDVAIEFDGYSHPDLGNNLTGTLRFDLNGGYLATENANAELGEQAVNVLWQMRLMDLDEMMEVFG